MATKNLQRSNTIHHSLKYKDEEHSPLKRFVEAKKQINGVFKQIVTHLSESCTFLQEVPDPETVSQKNIDDVTAYKNKVEGILEVLARDHMKVAFFGRTSSGKSTAINAMLKDKVVPTGIGHTTDCFLSIAGSDGDAYLVTPHSNERRNVQTVGQLAHALSSQRLEDQSSLIRVFWPKSRCAMLKDDLVLVDSPGVDVTADLDSWIDKHCLDADVFVLVANAESTLMRTEKSFFHKVSERLSKPNIFILNNRWDASASEPESMEDVKKQHLERSINFLVDELKVVTTKQAENRVFFVSAKEALQCRIQKQQGMPEEGGALAEGFQTRLFAFEDFERKFEECISETAVKTKFEQHSKEGTQIVEHIRTIMDEILQKATQQRLDCIELRKEKGDQLDYMENQLKMLAQECREKIKELSEEVERRVSGALIEEIRRLSVLVDHFDKPFHPDPLVVKHYKDELQNYIEEGIGRNLSAKVSSDLTQAVQITGKQMKEQLTALLPEEQKSSGLSVIVFPRSDFDLSYRLDCRNLCGDFKEDLEFKFSLGWTALVNRFLGPKNAKLALMGLDHVIPRPITAPQSSSSSSNGVLEATNQDDLAVSVMTGLSALTSQTSMGLMVVGGIVWKAVGWRLLAVGFGLYGCVYCYERLTWTNKAKQRSFKAQFVDYATEKLQLMVSYTSSNCSHQVQQELSSGFAQLCRQIDAAKADLNQQISALNEEVKKLETVQNDAKVLRNKSGWLDRDLDDFIKQYMDTTPTAGTTKEQ